MEKLLLRELAPTRDLPGDIFDCTTGMRLRARGEELTEACLTAFRNAGIERVAILGPTDSPEPLLHSVRFREIDTQSIRPGMRLANDVYTPQGKLLLARGTALSRAALERIGERGIGRLYVRRQPDPDRITQVKRALRSIRTRAARRSLPKILFGRGELIQNTAMLTAGSVGRNRSIAAASPSA